MVFRIFSSLLFLTFTNLVSSAAEPKPNVVVVLADDQGWGDLSIHGNTNLSTPAIDRLAQSGAQFSRFYVQPVCSPTRAEFLTGRYHSRSGVCGVSNGGERMNTDVATMADHFQAAGYRTGCFGKWHNGTQYPYHPNGRGFTEYYGYTSGHWGDYFSPPLDHNGKDVRGQGFLADDLTTHAIDFMKPKNASDTQPRFCYLALNTPHSPMQVPDDYWTRFANKQLKLTGTLPKRENIEHTRAALAMCENIDDNLGRLLKALEDMGMKQNTIVVYFSDNGPNGARWTGGMKGVKGSTDEGGVRSPAFVAWPGKIAAGSRIEPIAGAIDLLPTLTDLAQVPRQAKPEWNKPLDGISFATELLGQPRTDGMKPVDRKLFQHWNGSVSVRTDRYRLDAAGKLYDMLTDPGQLKAINEEQPEVAEQLTAAAAAWRQDVRPLLSKDDDRPFPVGYAAFPRTQLPARDGVPSGGIKRSANAPNCSYFTEWTTLNGKLTWSIDVATAGRYRVEILSTCDPKNTGATLEVRFGKNAQLQTKVTQMHNPKLYGDEHDRTPRVGESFMKDFQPWTVGEVSLPSGQMPLEIQATAIPGTAVIDLYEVRLTLLK